MKSSVKTPLRRLDGISYWVIEDPEAIHDFINTEIRKEWEEDVKSMAGDPASGTWLTTLPRRKWRLEIGRVDKISPDQATMSYVNAKTGYDFSERLAKRRQEMRKGIQMWGRVIWPIVVREEDMQVLDGYCRYTKGDGRIESLCIPREYLTQESVRLGLRFFHTVCFALQ